MHAIVTKACSDTYETAHIGCVQRPDCRKAVTMLALADTELKRR
jgi:hypothetical protein